jgi:hypothetical protein
MKFSTIALLAATALGVTATEAVTETAQNVEAVEATECRGDGLGPCPWNRPYYGYGYGPGPYWRHRGGYGYRGYRGWKRDLSATETTEAAAKTEKTESTEAAEYYPYRYGGWGYGPGFYRPYRPYYGGYYGGYYGRRFGYPGFGYPYGPWKKE